jgi:hypothetical protein
MSVRILYDVAEDRAAFYCSTTGVAFGPVMEASGVEIAREVAEGFLDYLAGLGVRDVSTLAPDTLANHYRLWRSQSVAVEAREGMRR